MTILKANSYSIDRKSSEIWTGQTLSQPISFKSDRLLDQALLIEYADSSFTAEPFCLVSFFQALKRFIDFLQLESLRVEFITEPFDQFGTLL